LLQKDLLEKHIHIKSNNTLTPARNLWNELNDCINLPTWTTIQCSLKLIFSELFCKCYIWWNILFKNTSWNDYYRLINMVFTYSTLWIIVVITSNIYSVNDSEICNTKFPTVSSTLCMWSLSLCLCQDEALHNFSLTLTPGSHYSILSL
jgi:hypothetical protein